MTNDAVREAFERFHGARKAKGVGRRERMFERLPDDTYADPSVQRHWWTWQNALEAQAAELAASKAAQRRAKIALDETATELARLRAEPAIAIVTTSHDYGATIDWHLNPLPTGTELYERPQRPAQPAPIAMPAGWVALRIEHEPGYPEDVAFGPQIMMDRLKKWLDKHFANLRAQPAPPSADALRELVAAYRGLLSAMGPDATADDERRSEERFERAVKAADAAIDAAAGKEST
jgi:hypothetical protein